LMVNNTRNEYHLMVNGTDVSFRCGAIALNDVLMTSHLPSMDIAKVMHTPSPVTGFSMEKLVELSDKAGFQVAVAEWGAEKIPVVPSVVHWKHDHYAAILSERNGLYQVKDLIFGHPIWLSAENIRSEASGYFIVPKDKVPSDWKVLSQEEAGQIYGRGYVSGAPDAPDGCGNGSGGGSGPGGGPDGNFGSSNGTEATN
jgi:Peptidase C39 family